MNLQNKYAELLKYNRLSESQNKARSVHLCPNFGYMSVRKPYHHSLLIFDAASPLGIMHHTNYKYSDNDDTLWTPIEKNE